MEKKGKNKTAGASKAASNLTSFRTKHWIIFNLILIFIAATAIIIISFSSLQLITRHNRELTVPSFTGMTIEQARKAAEDASLRIDITDSVYINRMERGIVYKQLPEAGSKVKKNRRILITINSLTPKLTPVPSLVGYSLRQAKTEINSAQLRTGKLQYVPDMATNNVLKQKYKGKEIQPGTMIETDSEIDLVLGLSPDDNITYIPQVNGYQLMTARDIIIENSLNVGKIRFDETVTTYADSISAFVYRQYPPANDTSAVTIGSKVDIYLTKDPQKTEQENTKQQGK